MERKLPFNLDAEKSVLGAVLIDEGCIPKVTSLIDALDFYQEPHRIIFRAFLSLSRKRKPIDLITLEAHLRAEGDIAKIGGAHYLASLIEICPTSANVTYHAKIVKEQSTARRLVAFAENIAHKGYGGGSLPELLTEAQEGLADITGSLDGMNGVSVADILTFDRRKERYEKHTREIDKTRFVTGFKDLDHCIRGVAPGEVMTIIAYSGTFKTALLQNLLIGGTERSGYFSLFFSLEMPVEKLFEREIQINGGVSGRDVEQHFSGRRVSLGVNEGLERIASHGLLVCDRPRLTLDKIGRFIELARQKHGKIAVVGIDYLGLMHAPGKTLFEKTAHLSIEIKNTAKELNVPIILLCQINRTGATSGGEIETYHAKGGGDIEAGADFMLGLYIDNQEQLVCKILKNRNGPAGVCFLVDMDRESLRFRGMTHYKPDTRKRVSI